MSVRLVDLLAGLSRLSDLGFGLPAGASLRSAALSAVLGREWDLPPEDVRAALYTSLLHHVGCTGYAHETASVFGNEITANIAAGRTNHAVPRDVVTTFLPLLLAGEPPLARARLVVAALARGARWGRDYTTAACEVGRAAARRLGLPDDVQTSLYHVYELWRGGGDPDGLAGEELPLAARVARLAGLALLFESIGGTPLAVEAVRTRAGGMLDPALAARFAADADRLLAQVNAGDPLSTVLAAEPEPAVRVAGPALTDVATVFADLADLKTPYTHGHSRGVATLAAGAAKRLGMAVGDATTLERAALLHDVGRVAVANTVWEKREPLTSSEWEEVRLHAYHSERILDASPELAPLGPLVGMHHERLDGSGYHRRSVAGDIPVPARLLAAADAYRARIERRPHRDAMLPEEAAAQLHEDGRRGLLDTEAVTAVLAVAGHRTAAVRRRAPAGLTDREIEVLRLLADGCTNAEVAARLVISRRTAEHHVQHIYTKIGVSSRAAAALFAMEHGLLHG